MLRQYLNHNPMKSGQFDHGRFRDGYKQQYSRNGGEDYGGEARSLQRDVGDLISLRLLSIDILLR